METTGILPAVRRRADPGRAAVLRYHSVSDFDSTSRLYRSQSIAVTPETFERQMQFLADWYRVVPLSVLVDCLHAEAPFPRHAVALTFDDGYRDNFVHALPILRRFGFPATVYVTTGAIGDGWRFWLSRVRACMLETSRTRLDLDELGVFDLTSARAREDAVERLTRQLKLLTVEERGAAIERIVAETGHDAPVQGSANWFMDWAQLKEMAASGISIGAHTQSHPILTRLSDEAAGEEIRRSREVLSVGLDRPVDDFAYPNGSGVINHDDRIAMLVRNAGFRSATTSVNAILRSGADPYRITRLGVSERNGVDGFALNLERDRLVSFNHRPDRPRLLLIGPPPDAPGGISTCVRTVLNSSIAARFDVSHIAPTGAGGFHQPRLVSLLAGLRAVTTCSVSLLLRRPAIVQVHTAYGADFWRSALFILLAAAHRVPCVLIIHGSKFDQAYAEASSLQKAVIRFLLRRVSAVHVRGEYWRDVVHSIVPGAPVHLLPTTTDPVDAASVAADVKWRAPVVLFVGGTTAVKDSLRKGLPDLLRVVPDLLAAVPHAKIQVVGPKSADEWRALVSPESDGRIEFLGSLSRDEIRDVYRSAAVFVLPSHSEGMPNAILEAMAHGLPIVATTVGSIPEIVEDGVGGVLFPAGDRDKLLAALVRLLEDRQTACRMGDHNRALVEARYTNRHTAERLLSVYASIQGASDRAP
jgi:glycosyltransferase involved in cell wall biosynthesis/peptidoglycan/xylan/chitin deacetylase (PgdA/CDA1 family)